MDYYNGLIHQLQSTGIIPITRRQIQSERIDKQKTLK